MARFRLTVRSGPTVKRQPFDELEPALAALGEELQRVRAEGGLPGVTMLREFPPGARVKARFEISTGSVLHRREAGLDLMGDGAVVVFNGGIRRRPFAGWTGSPVDAVRDALTEVTGR